MNTKTLFRYVATTLVLTAGFASSAIAADADLGLSSSKVPILTGERAIEVTVTLAGGKQFDQRPLAQRPRAGKVRLVLNYSSGQEGLSQNRLVVPTIQSLGGSRFRAQAILPQGQQVDWPANAGPIHLNSRYMARPSKIPHGAQVAYRWELQDENTVVRGDTHHFEMPHPLVFAVVGDSYGSGEGSPDNRSTFVSQVQWEHKPSHRSKHAGLAKGINAFRNDYPQLWIEARNFAISGATIVADPDAAGGIVNTFRADRNIKVLDALLATGVPTPVPLVLDPDTTITAQVTQVERWLSSNGFSQAHAILMSGGGNDAGFGDSIAAAIVGGLSFAFDATLDKFRENVIAMREAAESEFVAAFNDVVQPDQLLWMTYPNMTVDHNGAVSGIDVELSANTVLMLMDFSVGADDMRNAQKLLLDELNPAIRASCAEIANADNAINCSTINVESAIGRHGINANRQNRWFNTFRDAQDEAQGVIDGAVHPNPDGYQAYVEPVKTRLRALYEPGRGSEYRRFAEERRELAKAQAKEKAVQAARSRANERQNQSRQTVREFNQQLALKQLKPAISRQVIEAAERKRSARQLSSRNKLTDIYEMHLQRPNLRFKLPPQQVLSDWRTRISARYGANEATELDLQIQQLRAVTSGLNLGSLQQPLSRERVAEWSRQRRGVQASPVTRLPGVKAAAVKQSPLVKAAPKLQQPDSPKKSK